MKESGKQLIGKYRFELVWATPNLTSLLNFLGMHFMENILKKQTTKQKHSNVFQVAAEAGIHPQANTNPSFNYLPSRYY